MNRAILKRSYWVALAAVLCTVPFFTNYNSYCIAALVLIWLLNKPKLKSFESAFPVILVSSFYYLSQVYGWFISDNDQVALFVLEKKAGLWLLPIVISTGPVLTKADKRRLFDAFTIVVTAASVIFLIRASAVFFNSGSVEELYYHGLTQWFGVHAVYFSLVVAFCFFWQLFQVLKHAIVWRVVIAIFLSCILLLLASKTILAISLLLLIVVILKNKGVLLSKKKGIVFAAIFVLVSAVFGKPILNRFTELTQTTLYDSNYAHFKYDSPFDGLNLRILLWSIATEIVVENNAVITGVGTGDAQEMLNQSYTKKGMYVGNPELGDKGYLDYNVHNQYVNDWLCNGIFGLFSLFCLFGAGFFRYWKIDQSLVVFFLLFIVFSFTEATLERQAGNVLFACMLGLAYARE